MIGFIMSKSPFDLSFQERRCQLGIHNYINFMDSPIEIEYHRDIPEEVLICKICKQMTTPYELSRRMDDEWNNWIVSEWSSAILYIKHCVYCRLCKEEIMWFSKNTDEELLKQLIQMMEETSKELSVHIETLEKVGIVQKSITERLDHIESFLDRLYGNNEEEEERTIN